MSRIDTQSDRLLRGTEGFERQRTFLVQPERFAARQDNSASRLIQALGQTVGVVGEVRAENNRKAALVEQEKNQATMNQLLEAKNRANTDPNQFGEEYKRLYESALSSTEQDSPFRQDILRLDADNFVSSRVEAETRLVRSRVAEGMNNTFAQLGTTYTLDAEDAPDYIALSSTDRFNRIYDEVFDTLPEKIQDAVLEDETLKSLLTRQVLSISNKYQPDNDALVKENEQRQFRKDVDGISISFTTEKGLDEKSIKALASRYSLPLEEARVSVLDRTLENLILDMDQGSITPKEAFSSLSVLQSKAEGYGIDAERMVFETQNTLAGLVSQDLALDASSIVESGLTDGTPLDELADTTNDLLLSALSDYTGVQYNLDEDSIQTVAAEIGLPNSVLAQFRQIQNNTLTRLSAIQSMRNASRGRTPKSSFDELRESSALHSLREQSPDFALLKEQYGEGTPREIAFRSGALDFATLSSSHPNAQNKAKDIHDAFVEGSDLEVLWAVGGIGVYTDEVFSASISDLPQEQQMGLQEVYSAIREFGLDFDVENPEVIQELKKRYDSGLQDAQSIGAIGSREITFDLEKPLAKKLGIPSDSNMSDNLKRVLALEQSRLKGLDLDEAEVARLVSGSIKASNTTIYKDSITGEWDAFTDTSKIKALPQSIGVSEKDIARDFNLHYSGPRRMQIPEAEELPINRFMRLVGGHTPILGSIIAEDLDITTTGEATAMLEVSSTLAAKKHGKTEDPDAINAYAELFKGDEGSPNYLRLGIGSVGGQPYLTATGFINGFPVQGGDAILLTKWSPSWNLAIGKSREQAERVEELQDKSINAVLYLMDPETLGNKAGNFVIDALEAQENARQANPDAFKVRP